jgi:ActD protein
MINPGRRLMSTEVALSHLPGIYGAMAEFETPEDLIEAAERAHAEGYRRMDAYAPMPVEGLAEAVGFKTNKVALAVLLGGIAGCVGGYGLLFWITVIAYPHNVGGRPLHSWPAYIPITFECMILIAALTSLVAMLAMNGLPQPYHPVFNVPQFERASRDGFFLCIESSDPKFHTAETLQFLRDLGGSEVTIVPA